FFAIRFLTFAYKGRACRMAWFTTAGNAPSPDAYVISAQQQGLPVSSYRSYAPVLILPFSAPFRLPAINKR
ncbi:hypothetical protein, partial [Escherichia coli]|uniref:hypothetical protein n=1 Tax=Escherichia coli TaxID=562 RepID=UPI001BC9CF4B